MIFKLDHLKFADEAARLVIPALPVMKPHTRMLRHLRFILPLLPIDADGMSPLHYYDSAIQIARNVSEEPTESEFEIGRNAASTILQV
jgi:hypothetical protein